MKAIDRLSIRHEEFEWRPLCLLTVTPDIRRPRESYVDKPLLRQELCELIAAAVLNDGRPHQCSHITADVVLEAGFPPKGATIEATLRVHLQVNPVESTACPDGSDSRSLRDTLRGIVDVELGRVWDVFCLDRFIEDVQKVASSLHVLGSAHDRWVDEIVGAVQALEPVALRHGYDVGDFVDFRGLRTAAPEQLPSTVGSCEALLVDRGGCMLALDRTGILHVHRPPLGGVGRWFGVAASAAPELDSKTLA
jgi:hypothetical protein